MADDRIAGGIRRVDVMDATLDLFEGQVPVPDGVSENVYLIEDEKTALIGTVSSRRQEEWLGRLGRALNGRRVDYLVIPQVESDCAPCVRVLAERYPGATLIGNEQTFAMLERLLGSELTLKHRTVTEGDTLSLGEHTLHFLLTPMARRPESMAAYEEKEKALFSGDAFGRFGQTDGREPWEAEARRYYFYLFGGRGEQVQSLLKRLDRLELRRICPLHGPVLEEKAMARAIELYGAWSSYKPQERGVLIAYAGFRGHTAKAARMMADVLIELSDRISLVDLSREHVSHAVAEAFRFDRMVLASATYDGEMAPAMQAFLNALAHRGYRNRLVALIESGNWAPAAAQKMRGMLEDMRQITVIDEHVTIDSAPSEEDREAIQQLALEMDNLA